MHAVLGAVGPRPLFICPGNHDYGLRWPDGRPGAPRTVAAAHSLTVGGRRLLLVHGDLAGDSTGLSLRPCARRRQQSARRHGVRWAPPRHLSGLTVLRAFKFCAPCMQFKFMSAHVCV